ncbi:MAG: ParB N-terminal domain-containing protein, partial [Pseudomonadota bacterium]
HERFGVLHPPRLSRIRTAADLKVIAFNDGVAEVQVPVELLDALPLKHGERNNSPRLDVVMQSIRARGYESLDPVVCRIGAKGRWVVIDGGHRLTAAKQVAGEFWTNLFRRDLGDVTFILFETARSYTKLTGRPVPPYPDSAKDRDADTETNAV